MENHPYYKVFTEINFHNSRLGVLGVEAIRVLEDMKSEGMSSEVLEPLFAVAKKAAGLEECKTSGETKVKNSKRCKWWNRGFCRDREKCSFLHRKEDCQEHLSGGCTIKRCNTLRHRNKCKYFSTEEGCYRGESCAFLHIEDNELRENDNRTAVLDKEVQVEQKIEVKEKDSQTETDTCVCKEECLSYKVHLEEDKIICI